MLSLDKSALDLYTTPVLGKEIFHDDILYFTIPLNFSGEGGDFRRYIIHILLIILHVLDLIQTEICSVSVSIEIRYCFHVLSLKQTAFVIILISSVHCSTENISLRRKQYYHFLTKTRTFN